MGAASKGVVYTSAMDRACNEVWASKRRSREQRETHHDGGVLDESPDTPDFFCVSDDDPWDIADAMNHPDWPEWQASMGKELASLKAHDVYTLIPHDQVPLGKHVVPSKFVLQYKLDEHGKVCHHKSCVVTKGFAQCPGIDYNKTYAPVAHMELMRAVLHIGATLNWDIHQMDIKTAFLHGDLVEEVYMVQPMGGKEPGKEDWVRCLNKTLYGLMQATQGWNQCLHHTMVNNWYSRVSVDHCIYI